MHACSAHRTTPLLALFACMVACMVLYMDHQPNPGLVCRVVTLLVHGHSAQRTTPLHALFACMVACKVLHKSYLIPPR